MTKFCVLVFRTMIDNAGVEVEAPSSEMAEALAIQKVEKNSSQFEWCSYSCELEALDAEELGDDEPAPSAA